MTVTKLRTRIRKFIDTADEQKLQAIYTLAVEPFEDEYNLTVAEKKMLVEREQKHLRGESKSYSLAQVREHLEQKFKK